MSLCQFVKTDKYSETIIKTRENIIKQLTSNECINWADLNPFITALL